jgi:tripartite-type tricarboxylate transporter receptor subunit TctC
MWFEMGSPRRGVAARLSRRSTALVLAAALAAVGSFATAPAAMSQDWPARNVTMIVPFPPGGNTDSMARILAQKLSVKFGRSFVVENRMGASGSIGMMDAMRAKPDGYTLIFGAFQQISVLPYTETVNYDPKTDFAYISIFGEGPFVFAVHADVPAKSLNEFIAYAKSKPGALTYASGGVYSGAHLVAALFFSRAGVNLNHVPYRGGGPAIADLLGGHVQAYFGNASELIPISTDPRVRILATSSAKRMEQLPGVPTVNELYPGFVLTAWNGLMAPAKTPQIVKDKLEAATIEAAHDPQVVKTLGNLGIAAVGSTSQDFSARIAGETPLLAEAIKAAKSSGP